MDSPDPLETLYSSIDEAVLALAARHQERLQCRLGCTECCVDDITVYEVEADRIRRHHAELLTTGRPHPAGRCALLGEGGACRVYAHRPYVCRTQGLPLRWLESAGDGGPIERRDICSLNETGEAIESLAAEACWPLGPVEERLALLQRLRDGGEFRRLPLRALFSAAS